jgi:2'-5' RNA ligase
MRLFIAINFSDTVRERLLALRDECRALAVKGNFSLTENLHLTLVFLGECDAKQCVAAKDVLNAVIFESFPLIIDRTGRFERKGVDIVWTGIRANNTLNAVRHSLFTALKETGFSLESRKFSPHITLGREVVWRERYAFGAIPPIEECVNRIDLMKSERIGGKLVYTSICSQHAVAR